MSYNSIILDNSELSTTEDGDFLSAEERNVQIFAKQMLQGRLFLGHYQEKRLVEPLQAYRDVIAVNESEVSLKNDMSVVKKRLRNFYHYDNYWIGITDPNFIGTPNGYCFWVESNNNTFGYYWYKIKSVRFKSNEISLRLKVIRPMTEIDNQIQTHLSANENVDSNNFTLDYVLDNITNTVREKVIWFFTEALTANNIKDALTFVSILLVTLATSSVYAVGYLMEFLLKLIREISVFIHASTPVMIAVVNMIGKVIGGFYILIAMMWKGTPKDNVHPYAPDRYKAIKMPPRYKNTQPLSITEIE